MNLKLLKNGDCYFMDVQEQKGKLGSGGPCLSRRRFLALMTMATGAAMLPMSLVHGAEKLLELGSRVNVTLAGIPKGSGPSALMEAVRHAAEAATDFSWLSRGDSVLIKPAVNSGNPYPATTSPTCLKAVVALLKEKGAKRVIVSDMSGIEYVKLSQDELDGSTRNLMTRCGVAQAAEEAGAELVLPEEKGWDAFYEDYPVNGSSWKGPIMMPAIVKQVDHIVLLPRCSRHALAGASLGMKAAVGYWRTDTRLEYHHDAATLHEKTAESNTVSSLKEKHRLTLTLADQVLATYGPDEGYITAPNMGLAFASDSLTAHDMVSLAWLLECRKAAPEDQKSGRRDPYTVPVIVNMANKYITGLLGGIGQAVTAEKLERHDLTSIWDDRVLKHAFKVSGGVPRLRFIDANGVVPKHLKKQLYKMTNPTAVWTEYSPHMSFRRRT
jgi:uncharacterized protein (DUF362 family)